MLKGIAVSIAVAVAGWGGYSLGWIDGKNEVVADCSRYHMYMYDGLKFFCGEQYIPAELDNPIGKKNEKVRKR